MHIATQIQQIMAPYPIPNLSIASWSSTQDLIRDLLLRLLGQFSILGEPGLQSVHSPTMREGLVWKEG